jgi:hypothetical protein
LDLSEIDTSGLDDIMAVSMKALSVMKSINSDDFMGGKYCKGDSKVFKATSLRNIGNHLMPEIMNSDKLLLKTPEVECGFHRLSSKALIGAESISDIGSMPDFDKFDASNYRHAWEKQFTADRIKLSKKLHRELGGIKVRVNSPVGEIPKSISPMGKIAESMKMPSGRSLLYCKDQNVKQMTDALKPARSHRVMSTSTLGLMSKGIRIKALESEIQGSETDASDGDTQAHPRKAAIFNPTTSADIGDLAYKLIKKHLPSLDLKQDKLHYLKTVFPTFKIPNDIHMGQGFGEMALLSDNQLRMGTTVCMEDCELLVVRRSVFREVLVNLNKTELQKEIDFLKGFNIFDNWAEEKMIMKFSLLLAHIDLEIGEHVFREGDKVNGFYL